MITVKKVFDEECQNLVIDDKLIGRLEAFNTSFITRNSDHIEFFGGNLTGVHVVRFYDHDRDNWFGDILGTDETILEKRILDVESINQDHHVASDTMNLSCVWLTHAILNSKKLSKEKQHRGAIIVLLVLQYKFLTSRLFRHFKFPAQRSTAEATYAALSGKFAIKQCGSWMKVLETRAEDIIDQKNSNSHYKRIMAMSDDKDVIYVLSDTQSRIRSMLRGIYDVFLKIHHQGVRISSYNTTVELDGEEMIRDKTKSVAKYSQYISSIITDKESFVRDELLVVIEKIMTTMPPDLLVKNLEWISKNYRQRGAEEIEEVVGLIILHSLDYFNHHRYLVRNTADLPGLLGQLNGVYKSSKSSDPTLQRIKSLMYDIVKNSTGIKSDSTISAVRTGTMLYIVLRTMTMRYYSQ